MELENNKRFSTSFRPRFRDTDGVGHVNNAVFVTYLEVARSEWYQSLQKNVRSKDFSFILARVEIDYLAPIQLNAHIQVQMWVSKIGTKSWVFDYKITDQHTDIIYAQAKSVQVAYDYANNCTIVLPDKIKEKLQTLFQPDN